MERAGQVAESCRLRWGFHQLGVSEQVNRTPTGRIDSTQLMEYGG